MPKLLDLTGKKYGKLTCISYDKDSKKWLCQCDCGNKKYVLPGGLKSGNTKSCGCISRDKPPKTDLSGKRFGLLVCIEFDKNKGKWLCQCDCGNKCFRATNVLTSNKTKSCGCMEHAIKKLDGQRFGKLIVLKTEKFKGKTKCYCKCDCGKKIWIRKDELTSRKRTSCGCESNEIFSKMGKKNFNIYLKDNFVENTNLGSFKMKIPSTNTSGIKGVSWDEKKQKWIAHLGFKRKHYSKTFNNKEDAIAYRIFLEEQYFEPMLEKYHKKRG